MQKHVKFFSNKPNYVRKFIFLKKKYLNYIFLGEVCLQLISRNYTINLQNFQISNKLCCHKHVHIIFKKYSKIFKMCRLVKENCT